MHSLYHNELIFRYESTIFYKVTESCLAIVRKMSFYLDLFYIEDLIPRLRDFYLKLWDQFPKNEREIREETILKVLFEYFDEKATMKVISRHYTHYEEFLCLTHRFLYTCLRRNLKKSTFTKIIESIKSIFSSNDYELIQEDAEIQLIRCETIQQQFYSK